MKASKFTDAQKAFIIKQGEEGAPVAEICRKAGISQATYFNWKRKYAGMLPTDMKRLRAQASFAFAGGVSSAAILSRGPSMAVDPCHELCHPCRVSDPVKC